jgi:hypothetical protein
MSHCKIVKDFQEKTKVWVSSHYLNLAIFNALTIILVLLYSAKYFDPFWTISINVIIFILLIASIFLLGAESRSLFIISLLFCLFAGGIKVLGVNIWAERISIYMFQSFFLGVLLLFREEIKK